MATNEEQIIQKALRQNELIHKYVMAIDHALLWIAALSFAAFFHLSPSFDASEALLLSTLVAYGAYLCESGLGIEPRIKGMVAEICIVSSEFLSGSH